MTEMGSYETNVLPVSLLLTRGTFHTKGASIASFPFYLQLTIRLSVFLYR